MLTTLGSISSARSANESGVFARAAPAQTHSIAASAVTSRPMPAMPLLRPSATCEPAVSRRRP